MNARTQINIYDTDQQLYDQLKRTFPEQENSGTRWLYIATASDVELTFFAPSPKPADVEEIAPIEDVIG